MGTRWQKWVGGGALAGAVLGSGVHEARACHEDPDVPGYEKSRSVGLMLGFSFGPEVRFVYGVDVRLTDGRKAAFVRVEGHGITTARLAVGAHLLSNHDLGAEVGLAVQSARRDSDVAGSLGLHLAGGAYDGGGGLQAQGTIPFLGDLRNFDLGAAAVLVPNEVKLCLGGGRRLRAGEATILPQVAMFADDQRETALSRSWIEDARAEHASVWAFRRMAAELQALAAPAALAAAALAAARDEEHHTRLCVAQAGVPLILLPLGDDHASPRWRRPSTGALRTLAREAFLDGCLGEGIAAAQAEAASARARRAAAVDTQRRIAVDEQRHAELAWSVLEWTLALRDAEVRDAIGDLVRQDHDDLARPRDQEGDPDVLAHHGRLAPESARRVAETEIERALRRARTLLT
jgi:hypothetical protein